MLGSLGVKEFIFEFSVEEENSSQGSETELELRRLLSALLKLSTFFLFLTVSLSLVCSAVVLITSSTFSISCSSFSLIDLLVPIFLEEPLTGDDLSLLLLCFLTLDGDILFFFGNGSSSDDSSEESDELELESSNELGLYLVFLLFFLSSSLSELEDKEDEEVEED